MTANPIYRKLQDGTIELFVSELEGDALKKITYEQIIQAIELQTYPQGFGHLIEDDEKGHITNACAVGQCALNLGVGLGSLEYFFETNAGWDNYTLWQAITKMNDIDKKSLKQIARKLRTHWKPDLKKSIDLVAGDYSQFTNWKGVQVK